MNRIILSYLLLTSLMLTACGTPTANRSFVGTWRDETASEMIQFKRDGTILTRFVGSSGEITDYHGTYETPIPGRIRIDWEDGRRTTYQVEVKNNRLLIGERNKGMDEYVRVK